MAGRFADLRAVLVAGPDVGVVADGFVAYPTGCRFALDVRARTGDRFDFDPFGFASRRSRRGHTPSAEWPPELLRFGLLLADGERVTTVVGHRLPTGAEDPRRPARSVLSPMSGGGGPRRWRQDFWLWPLPPPGLLVLVAEWPAHGLAETRATLDAAALHAAAAQAIELWPPDVDEPPEEPPSPPSGPGGAGTGPGGR